MIEYAVSRFPDLFAAEIKLRRTKHFKRQTRISERDVKHQLSEPTTAPPALPVLQKHSSYPQYDITKRRLKAAELKMAQVRVTVIDKQLKAGPAETPESESAPRASHTPAIRSGPPLSCNFCWNTVDKCGRILRRKTQYHCPECCTNLCIVPCFHEYHEAKNSLS